MADVSAKKTSVRKKATAVPFVAPAAEAVSVAETIAEMDATAAVMAPVEIELPAVELPAVTLEEKPMTDTINQAADAAQNTAETISNRVQAAFGDASAKAKDAWAKGQANMTDMVDFNRGNVEALVQSARVAAKGVQDIVSYSVEYGRGAIETANGNTRRLTAVKSPTEFVQVQSEIARATLDEAVAQTSKFVENYLKLVGEVVQPISNRYALAAEKVRTTVAA